MRSTPRWLIAAALAVSIACKKEDDDGRRVVVLFTTDEHAQLFASAPEKDDFPLATAPGSGALIGGVARRAAILDTERGAARARGADTITLSAGDFSQGSLASAAWIATSPELVLMKRMGYDAVALGNHEFDLGPAALAAAVGAAAAQDAAPPLVLTNVIFDGASAADDALAALYGTEEGKPIAPHRVLHTAGGLRIGIVASMGVAAGTVAGAAPPVKFWTGADNTARFASVVAALQAAVDHLRGVEKVDAVILLGHGGIGATIESSPGEDEALALQVQGLDLVVSGHTHRSTPQPRIVYATRRAVPVVQAKPYGAEVGRVELVFPEEGSDLPSPYLDPAGTRFIAVDDRVVPTANAGFLNELYALTVGYLEAGNPAVPAYPSFLEETLSTVLGEVVTDDPAQLGELYYRPFCRTDFDVVGLAPGETNGMNLDTDALLAAARAYAAGPTLVAVQASGPIRADLRVGAEGVITFADLYRVVPLGGDPTVPDPATDPNAVPGYPLVRAVIPTAAVRGVFEATLQQALLDGDFFLGASGLVVKYDTSRPPWDQSANGGVGPGWVTYMALDDGTTETVLYDVSLPFPHFAVNPATHVTPVVTTLYVAGFAASFGVPLLNDVGQPYASPALAVLRRGDGSAVKDYEALATYVKAECDGNATKPGFLPARYSEAVPRRVIPCTGGCP